MFSDSIAMVSIIKPNFLTVLIIFQHTNKDFSKIKLTPYEYTKSMAMWGNHIRRVKVVIKDNIIEQVIDFKYLGYRIS